jgi:hypothetical protein
MKDPLWGVITSNKNEMKVGKKLKETRMEEVFSENAISNRDIRLDTVS